MLKIGKVHSAISSILRSKPNCLKNANQSINKNPKQQVVNICMDLMIIKHHIPITFELCD